MSDQRGRALAGLVADPDEPQIESQAAKPVPLFQFVARGDPPGGDDVRPLPAVAAERRDSMALRARSVGMKEVNFFRAP